MPPKAKKKQGDQESNPSNKLPPKTKPTTQQKGRGKKGQQTIKEMLSSKPERSETVAAVNHAEPPQSTTIPLPYMFDAYVKITEQADPANFKFDPVFNCSKTARVYFRDHSNLNYILREFMKTVTVQDKPLSAYTAAVIRGCMSPSRRCVHPYDKFRFNSLEHEAIARQLLIYPNINCQEIVDDLKAFNNAFDLKLCSVAMYKDNDVRDDAFDFYRGAQGKKKTKGSVAFSVRLMKRYIEQKYYERKGCFRHYFLTDMTKQHMEDVTNFRKVIYQMMEEDKMSEDDYDVYSDVCLRRFKVKPDMLDRLSYHLHSTNPKALLITNTLTTEQQEEIANDFESFYKNTSASQIYKLFRRNMTQLEFHDQYKNRNNYEKKLPPYDCLRYYSEEVLPVVEPEPEECLQFVTIRRYQNAATPSNKQNLTEPVIPESYTNDAIDNASAAVEAQAITSATGTIRKRPAVFSDVCRNAKRAAVVLEPTQNSSATTKKQHAEGIPTNASTPAHIREISPSASSGESRETVLSPKSSSFMTAEDDEGPEIELVSSEIPPHLLSDQEISEEVLDFLEIIHNDIVFTCFMKEWLKKKYEKNFAEIWKQHRDDILSNYIDDLWRNNIQMLLSLTNHCSPSFIQQAQNAINGEISARNAGTRGAAGLIEEGSCINISMPAAETAKRVSGQIAVVYPSIAVKEEQISDFIWSDSSDVDCLGSMRDQVIVIDDSEDEDHDASLKKALDADPNPFLREIDAGTQPEMLSGSNQHSDETLNRIEKFVPVTVRDVVRDIEVQKQKRAMREMTNDQPVASTSTGTKRKIVNRPCPKSKKIAIVPIPGGVDYLDDDDSHSPSLNGNNSQTDQLHQALNDDFSVFLSTELIDARIKEDTEPSTNHRTLSYAKSSSTLQATTDTTCFFINLQQVVFEKNVKFELHVSLPQFTLYNIIVQDEDIKSVLNLSANEFNSLLSLLNIVKKYEYTKRETRPARETSADGFILRQLDMFFSFHIKFKTFQLQPNGDTFSFVD